MEGGGDEGPMGIAQIQNAAFDDQADDVEKNGDAHTLANAPPVAPSPATARRAHMDKAHEYGKRVAGWLMKARLHIKSETDASADGAAAHPHHYQGLLKDAANKFAERVVDLLHEGEGRLAERLAQMRREMAGDSHASALEWSDKEIRSLLLRADLNLEGAVDADAPLDAAAAVSARRELVGRLFHALAEIDAMRGELEVERSKLESKTVAVRIMQEQLEALKANGEAHSAHAHAGAAIVTSIARPDEGDDEQSDGDIEGGEESELTQLREENARLSLEVELSRTQIADAQREMERLWQRIEDTDARRIEAQRSAGESERRAQAAEALQREALAQLREEENRVRELKDTLVAMESATKRAHDEYEKARAAAGNTSTEVSSLQQELAEARAELDRLAAQRNRHRKRADSLALDMARLLNRTGVAASAAMATSPPPSSPAQTTATQQALLADLDDYVTLHRECGRLRQEHSILEESLREALVSADAYKQAFEEQLRKNSSRLLSGTGGAGRDALRELVNTLGEKLKDKTEALAHQKVTARMLAKRIYELEDTVSTLQQSLNAREADERRARMESRLSSYSEFGEDENGGQAGTSTGATPS